jgi:hypothetical protein
MYCSDNPWIWNLALRCETNKLRHTLVKQSMKTVVLRGDNMSSWRSWFWILGFLFLASQCTPFQLQWPYNGKWDGKIVKLGKKNFEESDSVMCMKL